MVELHLNLAITLKKSNTFLILLSHRFRPPFAVLRRSFLKALCVSRGAYSSGFVQLDNSVRKAWHHTVGLGSTAAALSSCHCWEGDRGLLAGPGYEPLVTQCFAECRECWAGGLPKALLVLGICILFNSMACVEVKLKPQVQKTTAVKRLV